MVAPAVCHYTSEVRDALKRSKFRGSLHRVHYNHRVGEYHTTVNQ
jgi:hypothetical protein